MNSKPTKAFIFAAGLGTRMRPLTEKMPKPLIKVADKALLDHQIEMVVEAGIKEIGINSFYLADQIHGHVQKYLECGINIRIFHESERLETGGGLINAIDFLGYEPVFTLNSDVIFTYKVNPLSKLMKSWDAEKYNLLMLMVEKENSVGFYEEGNFDINENGFLNNGPDKRYIYTGLEIINTELLKKYKAQKIFSLSDVFKTEIDKQKAGGIVHDSKWLHVGCLKGLQEAERFFKTK